MKQRLNSSGKKYIILTIVLILFQSGLLFISAGKVSIFRYWLFVTIQLVYIIFSFVILYFTNPELLNVRGEKKEDAKKWDIILVKIANILMIFFLPVIIGLDYRNKWLYLNLYYLIPGFFLYVFSNVLVLSSMIANVHFETNVRIQNERNHEIIKSWPYNFVRHPGYLGTILWLCGVPLILGSLCGLFFSMIISLVFIYRTKREDKFLANKLDGYNQYQNEVLYKLIPGIW